jgi:hypothetical protein
MTRPQLPAVSVLSEVYSKRPDESEADYWALVEWLESPQPRKAVPAAHRQLAQKQDWATRAAAYDREWELQRANANGMTPERDTVQNLTQVVQLEVRKLLKMAAQSESNVMSVKEITAVMTTIQGFHEEARKSEAAKIDLSSLPDAELELVLKAQAIMQRLKEAKR